MTSSVVNTRTSEEFNSSVEDGLDLFFILHEYVEIGEDCSHNVGQGGLVHRKVS